MLYPNSRVRTLVLWFPLSIPAWLYPGGWFLYQIFKGNNSLVHPTSTGGSGVAFFAHVGGFIFGVLVARVLFSTGLIRARSRNGKECSSTQLQPRTSTTEIAEPLTLLPMGCRDLAKDDQVLPTRVRNAEPVAVKKEIADPGMTHVGIPTR